MAASANITYSLSDETGLSAELCKLALERTKNNVDGAKQLLERWSGRKPSAAKEGNTFGVVYAYFEKEFEAAAIVKVQCTDELLATSKEFYSLVGEIAQETVQYSFHYIAETPLSELESKHKCQITVTSERFNKEEKNELSLFTTYTHKDRIGVMVETEVKNKTAFDNKLFKAFSFDLALHIAAFEPLAVRKDDIPVEMRDEIRSKIEKDLMRTGKPLALWPTVTDGKLSKWAEQRSLLNQIFIKSDKDTVAEVMSKLEEKIGSEITIKRFARLTLGS
jgi:elongation factor Ts